MEFLQNSISKISSRNANVIYNNIQSASLPITQSINYLVLPGRDVNTLKKENGLHKRVPSLLHLGSINSVIHFKSISTMTISQSVFIMFPIQVGKGDKGTHCTIWLSHYTWISHWHAWKYGIILHMDSPNTDIESGLAHIHFWTLCHDTHNSPTYELSRSRNWLLMYIEQWTIQILNQ